MSEMTYFEKLLDGLEVVWIALEDVAVKISSGGTPRTGVAEYYDGDIPWLRTQEVDFGEIWDTGVKITEAGIKNSSAKMIPENCVIVAMYGATVGKTAINKIPMTTNQACANIQLNDSIANYRYVFHFLHSQYKYIKSLGSGSQTNINAGIVRRLRIPIPCPENPQKSLEIQTEIVRILDTFTDLTSELRKELAGRKKQYEYYRDQLLSFDGKSNLLKSIDIEWRRIGDLGSLVRGNGLPKSDFTESGIPAIHYGQIYTYYGLSTTSTKSFVSPETAEKLKKVDKGDVVITNTSENLNDVGKALVYLGDQQAVAGGHATIFKPDENILGKYFAYFTQTDKFFSEKRRYSKGTKVIDVSANDMSNILIPIPYPNNPEKSLDIQNQIVRILDSFTSLIEELEKEIRSREQQFEYYRDLLFSFPRP